MGDIYSIYSGNTPYRKDKENFENPTTPWIKTTDLNNTLIISNEEMISDKAVKKLKMMPKETVLLAMYGGFNQIGRTGMLTYEATINQAMSALPPISNVKPYFLITQLNHRINDWKSIAASSRKDPNITKNDVEKFKLNYPTIFEQESIANFFKTLDSIITLHKRKLEQLENVKFDMMHKFFAEKEDLPAIRFQDFSLEWSKKKLGNISKSYSGGTPTSGKKEYYGGEIPFIRSAEINKNKTELYLTEQGFENSSAKMVEIGDVLYALYGATSGEVGMARIKGAINQAILSISPNDGYNAHFIMHWLRMQKQQIIDTYLQGGQGNLSGNIVKDLVLKIPCQKEQVKVSEILMKLEVLTLAQNEKVSLLQNLKKSYLQKMFI